MNMNIISTSTNRKGLFGRLSDMVFNSVNKNSTPIYSSGGVDFIHVSDSTFTVKIADTEKSMTLDNIRAAFGVFTAYQLESRVRGTRVSA